VCIEYGVGISSMVCTTSTCLDGIGVCSSLLVSGIAIHSSGRPCFFAGIFVCEGVCVHLRDFPFSTPLATPYCVAYPTGSFSSSGVFITCCFFYTCVLSFC